MLKLDNQEAFFNLSGSCSASMWLDTDSYEDGHFQKHPVVPLSCFCWICIQISFVKYIFIIDTYIHISQ